MPNTSSGLVMDGIGPSIEKDGMDGMRDGMGWDGLHHPLTLNPTASGHSQCCRQCTTRGPYIPKRGSMCYWWRAAWVGAGGLEARGRMSLGAHLGGGPGSTPLHKHTHPLSLPHHLWNNLVGERSRSEGGMGPICMLPSTGLSRFFAASTTARRRIRVILVPLERQKLALGLVRIRT